MKKMIDIEIAGVKISCYSNNSNVTKLFDTPINTRESLFQSSIMISNIPHQTTPPHPRCVNMTIANKTVYYIEYGEVRYKIISNIIKKNYISFVNPLAYHNGIHAIDSIIKLYDSKQTVYRLVNAMNRPMKFAHGSTFIEIGNDYYYVVNEPYDPNNLSAPTQRYYKCKFLEKECLLCLNDSEIETRKEMIDICDLDLY